MIGSVLCFFFQAEDGIRDLVRSRGLGDVYKRQTDIFAQEVIQLGQERGILLGDGECALELVKRRDLSLIHI